MARREQIAQAKQTVAIIGGTGALGFGLAVRWAIAGVPIVIGSRDAGRAAESAEKVSERTGGGDVSGYQNEEAAGRASTVLLSVPFRSQAETLNNLRYALQPQTTLIDATVPLAAAIGGWATRSLGVWQGSAAQQAAEMAPRGVTIVSAFHSVSATALADPSRDLDEDVLIAGDDREVEGRRGRAREADSRPAAGRLRRPGDGAHPRAAHAAADLGQQAPQDQALRRQADRPRPSRWSCCSQAAPAGRSSPADCWTTSAPTSSR